MSSESSPLFASVGMVLPRLVVFFAFPSLTRNTEKGGERVSEDLLNSLSFGKLVSWTPLPCQRAGWGHLVFPLIAIAAAGHGFQLHKVFSCAVEVHQGRSRGWQGVDSKMGERGEGERAREAG